MFGSPRREDESGGSAEDRDGVGWQNLCRWSGNGTSATHTQMTTIHTEAICQCTVCSSGGASTDVVVVPGQDSGGASSEVAVVPGHVASGC